MKSAVYRPGLICGAAILPVEAVPMSIEWYRDLSITLLGFVATAWLLLLGSATLGVLIIAGILVYRSYRTAKSILLFLEESSRAERNNDTMQVGIKPLIGILALIVGLQQSIEAFRKRGRKGPDHRTGNG
jgi:hypothetical protein